MLRIFLRTLLLAATLASPGAAGIAAAEAAYAPQTGTERGIKVTVILQDNVQAAKDLAFSMSLETHSRALDEDMPTAAVLLADGRRYLPVGWEGAPPGGHHRKGLLRFRAITPQPRVLELQLRLADDPAPRSFKWRLK